jgi:hypothetical protein
MGSSERALGGEAGKLRVMNPLIVAVFVLGFVALSRAEEALYNGIVLPAEWPPKVEWEDIKSRKPLPAPPYLQNPPAVIPIDVGRQLFVDDFLVGSTTLARTFHQAEYYTNNPIFKEAMVFSGGVWFDPKDQLFKMWYFKDGTGYTTSKDGIHWASGTNVLSGATDSQLVWLDLNEGETDKRFKMTRTVKVAPKQWRGIIYYSADGIGWREAGQTGLWGDRSTFFYNPFRARWIISARGYEDPRARRYWELKELTGPYWGEPGQPERPPLWVGSDELDPQRPDYKIPCQLYNLDCVAYESVLLGLFTIWRGQPPPRQKPNEVCVGFSRDGFNWSRPDRRAFCPVSETPGDWNYANVQSAGGCCLVVGDKLYFYVSGRGQGQVTSLATLRRDGFASMDSAEGKSGTLLTRPLKFTGKHLFVNLEAPAGELTVEVLDENNNLLARSQPISGDKTLLRANWKDRADLGQFAGKPVRFRFQLREGKLYSFWVSDSKTGASHGYVAAGGPGFTSSRDGETAK